MGLPRQFALRKPAQRERSAELHEELRPLLYLDLTGEITVRQMSRMQEILAAIETLDGKGGG